MILRRFYINLTIRIICIFLTMIPLAIIIGDLFAKQLMFTFLVGVTLLIFQIVLLFNYLGKTNKLIAKFMLIISDQEFVSKIGGSRHTPYKELNSAFNKILDQYQEVLKEKGKQYYFTQQLIQMIPTGVLVFNDRGSVIFKNSLGEDLLNLKEIYSIKSVSKVLPDLYNQIIEHKESGNFLYDLTTNSEVRKLAITVKNIILFDQTQKLISIQDVSKEIDAGELDAIHKLMRILTHEIMNSITPINSLTETLEMLMSNGDGDKKPFNRLTEKNYEDIRDSVIAIKERSEGIDHFVNNFRRITKLPEKLEKEKVSVKSLFGWICKIMNAEIKTFEIETEIEPANLFLNVDVALVEQILINLLTNSLAAVSGKEKPKIILKASKDKDQTIIQVYDNGVGIQRDKINDIFMPFYTTKEDGSGIGLSLAKQIMNLHKGSISVQSKKGIETTFTLRF